MTEFVSRITFSAAFENSLIDPGGQGRFQSTEGERLDLYHDSRQNKTPFEGKIEYDYEYKYENEYEYDTV